jgi:lipid II:glycine glycyltransferase (peptidoglycan interpeptide bridge formation enzyme)
MTAPNLASFNANDQLTLLIYKIDELTREVRRINEDHEKRLREVEESVTRLSERMTIWQIGQAAYSSVVAAIAAVIGR